MKSVKDPLISAKVISKKIEIYFKYILPFSAYVTGYLIS